MGAEALYSPRRPEGTVLYRVVRDRLATFLASAEERYERPLPRYVENELRGYLKCGIFSYGFVRCHCDACGKDMLVAFSCKNRGVCPSCAARRMCNGAAHLVDRVLPNVPVRQWVVSLPFELRRLVALRPEVLTAVARIVYERVTASYRERAGIAGAQTAAVTCVQRFGGSLNLNPHLHDIWADGVFTFENGAARFHDASPPERGELERVVRDVGRRIVRWLARRGFIGDGVAHASGELPAPMDAFADISLVGGGLSALGGREEEAADPLERREARFSAEHDGFNLHAGVRIEADDDEGRERLCRYALRPCFALERLTELADGRLAYRVKGRRGGKTHRVMEPLELLARFCALVPPPRYPLVRYHGVLAPRSLYRRLVVSRAPAGTQSSACAERHRGDGATEEDPRTPAGAPTRAPSGRRETVRFARRAASEAGAMPALNVSSPARGGPDPSASAERAVNTITVRHWGRLQDGALLAVSPRLDWATLLRRTYGIDAMECPGCHGRMRPMAVITDRDVARKILSHLGMDANAPVVARARDPTWDDTPAQATLPWVDS